MFLLYLILQVIYIILTTLGSTENLAFTTAINDFISVVIDNFVLVLSVVLEIMKEPRRRLLPDLGDH